MMITKTNTDCPIRKKLMPTVDWLREMYIILLKGGCPCLAEEREN